MGAAIEATEGRFPPLRVEGRRLRAVSHELPVASAQVKSCLLFAGLTADGTTTVAEPVRSRDHTERMLLRAGVAISRHGSEVAVVNADELQLDRVHVPADPSSAAFLVTAGVLVPGSRLLLSDVGVNWTRSGFFRILRRMQGIVLGDLEVASEALSAEEPVSDLDVAYGALEGTVVEPDEVPLAIDELPLVALLG
jgi:3-phosphoshikimate 1-carboxyvinyltransferase